MAAPEHPPDECANCGAAISRSARVCPACGADERTGWRNQSIYDGLDLPDAAFEDFASPPPARRTGPAWYWWVVGVGILVLFSLSALGLR